MRKHWQYLKYVLRHKWFVFVAACQLGIPFRGLTHDFSKFLLREWIPYVRHFYGSGPSPRDATGAYNPLDVGSDFDRAWLSHQHRNDHHWQWWILRGDEHTERVLLMSDGARKEMLADWIGAGRALGKPNVARWYLANRDKMVLAMQTRDWIEQRLGINL